MTEKKLIYPNGSHIAYTVSYGARKIGLIYLHGLLSSRKSDKGRLIAEYAQKNGFSFLSLDYTAHGESSGTPDSFRVGQCLQDILAVLKEENYTEPFILIGSSLGGWLSFLTAEKYPQQTIGVMTLAAGADFMPRIWNMIFDDKIRALLKSGQVLGPSEETKGYCFSYPMFEDAENYLILNRIISYNGPVLLVHGDKDEAVPYQTSFEIKNALSSTDVSVLLVKNERHLLQGFNLSLALEGFIQKIGC